MRLEFKKYGIGDTKVGVISIQMVSTDGIT